MKNFKPITIMKNHTSIGYKNDPMVSMMDQGLITKVGKGIFVISGVLVDIVNKVDNIIRDLADTYHANYLMVPSNLSWDNAILSDYLSSFENQAIGLKSFLHSSKDEYDGLASPTVCYHCFSALKNQTIRENSIYTASSKCTRKETGELNSLARLSNFTMREIIFLGSDKYCKSVRMKILEDTYKILSEILDIEFKICTATDPFFSSDSELKGQAQLASESKYEIQALVPFNNTYVSVASFNYHGKIFFDRFNISSDSLELHFSGCAGWGLERLLYIILCQKGLDFSDSYYKRLLK
ncbi:MAG: hypothetical protein CMG63_04555 [Candidatus Marinimicrobia bacterium]|nr:hypothetical protein [Candidatus Neomarinimicrobiota bacterium]|tara:strand:- start:807 stop:1694 length:888 start_codon:yes stop_codon:yes gene_type:complete